MDSQVFILSVSVSVSVLSTGFSTVDMFDDGDDRAM
jgi:hypothetical protein